MVGTQEPLAADVGLRVLQSGGNAIDAAVAVGFALAVTYPFAGNIGGGGFLLARFADGRTTFIDFRERAPLAATREHVPGLEGQRHARTAWRVWRAAGVPGTVRGLELAHKKYGRKRWAELVEPGRANWRRTASRCRTAWRVRCTAKRDQAAVAVPGIKTNFLERAVLRRQARAAGTGATLKRIRDRGASDFYEGETARSWLPPMAAHGGSDHAGRSESLPSRRARAAARRIITATRLSRRLRPARAASGFCRCWECWRARDTKRRARVGRFHPLCRRGDAPLLRRPQRVFRRSRFLPGAGCASCWTRTTSRAAAKASIREHATPSASVRPGDVGVREGTETTHFNSWTARAMPSR